MKWRHCIILFIVATLFLTSSIGASAEAILELPANLEIIDEEAFFGSSSLGKVVLSDRVRMIGKRAFANSSLTEIEIPNPGIEIADDAFDNHTDNLLIKGRSGSTAETYAAAHNIRFAVLDTTVIMTSNWEDFAGASSSLVQNYEGAVSVSSEGSIYANGRLIVKMDGELPDLTQYNPETIIRDPENHYLIQFSDSDAAENCADYLNTTSGVVYVEPDQNFSGSDMYIDDFETQSFSWGVSATNADAYAADLRKRNVSTAAVVAVVDTGVDAGHPMLSGRLLSGYDFVDNDNTPQDGNRHGTHVSGTVVDCTPGLNVYILPVRVLNNEGRGSNSIVAQGIRYAARNNADVINLSLGGGHSNYTDEAINYALQNGITVVVAAGNETENTAYHCPAHISDCITVSAVNQNLQRAYFSNYGDAVDIAAPGVNINSAIPGGGYASLNGTSMATPHVSAAAAMLLCDDPSLSPASVASMLRSAATDLGTSGSDVYYGAGLLNLEPFIKGKPQQYTINYDANGGTGAPASQTKVEGIALTLSSTKPSRANSTSSYTVTFNANSGNVSPTFLTAARTTSYTFRNWNTKADGSGTMYSLSARYSTEADVTLYAQWNSSTTTESVTLPTPTRAGYIFKGWATNTTASSGITGSYTPSGNVTLYAVWSRITYTVSFNANGGSNAPAAQTKNHGSTLTLSSNTPTRANSDAESYSVTFNANGGSVSPTSLTAARTTSYSFKNWNTKFDGSGTSYSAGASYTTNADATLYAQWNSSTVTNQVSLPVPTRSGYSFKGWSTDINATAGSTGMYKPSGNVTLYAIWEKLVFTVSYNANGGSGTPGNQTKEYGTALTLSAVKPSRASSSAESYSVTFNANGGSVSPTSLTAARTTSYSFKNWNTKSDGSGTSYNPGASYTADAALTLYAQWNSSTETAAVTLPTPTRSGYAFKGWATSSSASSGVTGGYTPNGSITLYAVWEELPKYTVVYNANGGSGAPASQVKTQGIDITLSSVKPSRADSSAGSYTVTLDANGGTVSTASLSAARSTSYSFKNWNTAADGSGPSYALGASYMLDMDVTLFAQWSENALTAAVMLPIPERDGYTFKGWSTDSADSYGVTDTYTPSGDVTLYALWQAVYTVSYDANGGTEAPGTQIKPQGESIILSTSVPTRASIDDGSYTITLDPNGGTVRTDTVNVPRTTYYVFESWNTKADGSGKSFASGESYAIDENITLYAQWSSSMETSAVMLPRAYRADRDFLGWSATTNTLTAQYPPGESYTFEEDATLYAIWSRDIIGSGYCGKQDANAYNYQLPYWALDRDGLLTITNDHYGARVSKMKDYSYPNYPPWNRESLKRIIIYSGVDYIGTQAFEGASNLVSIVIPTSMTSIGARAFGTGNYTFDVYYGGSEAQWDQISIGQNNSVLLNATIHFNCPLAT